MEILELIILVAPVALGLFFLGLGFFVGGWTERSHFKRLDERESKNGDFLITQLKTYPEVVLHETPPAMLVSEAIIACDYLKSFLGKIRNLFGGEIKSYQSLLVRARREALQRIVDQARAAGYNAICNVRFENADVGGNTASKKKGAVMATILASATAYHRPS